MGCAGGAEVWHALGAGGGDAGKAENGEDREPVVDSDKIDYTLYTSEELKVSYQRAVEQGDISPLSQ